MRKVLAACIIGPDSQLWHRPEIPRRLRSILRGESLAPMPACRNIQERIETQSEYSGLTVTSSTNDQVVVSVTYLLSGSGATENVENNGYEMAKTKQTTYIVQMALWDRSRTFLLARQSSCNPSAGRSRPTSRPRVPLTRAH